MVALRHDDDDYFEHTILTTMAIIFFKTNDIVVFGQPQWVLEQRSLL